MTSIPPMPPPTGAPPQAGAAPPVQEPECVATGAVVAATAMGQATVHWELHGVTNGQNVIQTHFEGMVDGAGWSYPFNTRATGGRANMVQPDFVSRMQAGDMNAMTQFANAVNTSRMPPGQKITPVVQPDPTANSLSQSGKSWNVGKKGKKGKKKKKGKKNKGSGPITGAVVSTPHGNIPLTGNTVNQALAGINQVLSNPGNAAPNADPYAMSGKKAHKLGRKMRLALCPLVARATEASGRVFSAKHKQNALAYPFGPNKIVLEISGVEDAGVAAAIADGLNDYEED